jgi:hypothetical protein
MVYSIQHYVINFVSDLRQVSGFQGVVSGKPGFHYHTADSLKCNVRMVNNIRVRVMMFNATFNNVLAMSWRSVLLVD